MKISLSSKVDSLIQKWDSDPIKIALTTYRKSEMSRLGWSRRLESSKLPLVRQPLSSLIQLELLWSSVKSRTKRKLTTFSRSVKAASVCRVAPNQLKQMKVILMMKITRTSIRTQ